MKTTEQFNRKFRTLNAVCIKTRIERLLSQKRRRSELDKLRDLTQKSLELESLATVMSNASEDAFSPMVELENCVSTLRLKSQFTSAIYYNLVAHDLSQQRRNQGQLVIEANEKHNQTLRKLQLCDDKLRNLASASYALRKLKIRASECCESLAQEELLSFQIASNTKAKSHE